MDCQQALLTILTTSSKVCSLSANYRFIWKSSGPFGKGRPLARDPAMSVGPREHTDQPPEILRTHTTPPISVDHVVAGSTVHVRAVGLHIVTSKLATQRTRRAPSNSCDPFQICASAKIFHICRTLVHSCTGRREVSFHCNISSSIA